MVGIKVLQSFKNYVILYDVNDKKIYCNSYGKYLGYYKRNDSFVKNSLVEFTPTNKKHWKMFKESIDNGEFF